MAGTPYMRELARKYRMPFVHIKVWEIEALEDRLVSPSVYQRIWDYTSHYRLKNAMDGWARLFLQGIGPG